MQTRNLIAVLAPSNDAHAKIVVNALSILSLPYQWFTGAEHIETNPTSIRIAEDARPSGIAPTGSQPHSSMPTVVWNRRPPNYSSDAALHPDDKQFAQQQVRTFQAAIEAQWSNAKWINIPANARSARCKPTQLRVASALGLTVPRTLVSNDPDAIRAFCAQTSECIYKPLKGFSWTDNGKAKCTFTSTITGNDLTNDSLLRSVPGIYQQRIRRTSEVRVQVFGRTLFAVQISDIPPDAVDYRNATNRERSARRVVPPGHIASRCLSLVRKLGLASAAIDFIVDETGQWVFLEVNESGQFLFLESWCADATVLDAFVGFLQSGADDYVHLEKSRKLRLSSIAGSSQPIFSSLLRDTKPGASSRDAAPAKA